MTDPRTQHVADTTQPAQTRRFTLASDDLRSFVYSSPFYLIHLGCLGVFWAGTSITAVGIAVLSYTLRMLAITAFYHRYFAHRTFKTGRVWQFLFAVAGATSGQKGVLWWASQHRSHHRNTDKAEDPHSPIAHGFLRSHLLWFSSAENLSIRWEVIPELARFPELRFVDRYASAIFLSQFALMYALGAWLADVAPELETSGAQLLVWGGCMSSVALYHATFCVNSVCHLWGSRPFDLADNSRNNVMVALLTLGEGWHNNHHAFPASARQGLLPGQPDLTWQFIRLLRFLGIAHSVRQADYPVGDSPG